MARGKAYEKPMTPTEQDKELLNADEQQYRFAHNPLAHQLFHTFRAMVTKKGIDAALADIAEYITADRKRVALEARIDELRLASDMQYMMRREDRVRYCSKRITELKAQQCNKYE